LRRRGTLAAEFDVDGFDGIFHYSSNTKPWQDWFEDSSRKLYEKYAATAPMRMAGDPMPRFYRDSFRYTRALWRRRRPGRSALACANGVRLVARGVGRRLLRPFT